MLQGAPLTNIGRAITSGSDLPQDREVIHPRAALLQAREFAPVSVLPVEVIRPSPSVTQCCLRCPMLYCYVSGPGHIVAARIVGVSQLAPVLSIDFRVALCGLLSLGDMGCVTMVHSLGALWVSCPSLVHSEALHSLLYSNKLRVRASLSQILSLHTGKDFSLVTMGLSWHVPSLSGSPALTASA